MPSPFPTPASAAVHAPVRRRKDERPKELLDAALTLFVEKGFAATRAEEVAARAGVSKGTLYLYFASKEELLKAVIRERLGAEIEAGAALAQRHQGSMAELLSEVFAQWWLRVLDSPTSGVFKLIITEARNFPELADFYTREVIEPGQAVIGRIIERGIANGEFAPVDVPVAVHSLMLPMVMLCMHKHSLGACAAHQQDLDPMSFVHGHINLLLGGLVKRPTAGAPGRARQAATKGRTR